MNAIRQITPPTLIGHSYRESKQPVIPELTVIIPFYNESETLFDCHQRVTSVLASLDQNCEILYVDDGSEDDSWLLLNQYLNETKQPQLTTKCIRLSRNFGKEAAMTAGLHQATGRAVVLLDADLQDPPELIPEMLEAWRDGYDVVDMQRSSRAGESWFKKFTARSYYRVMSRLSDIEIPENVGDFRLLDRKVVDQINQLPERTRFMKGLFAWPGFKRTIIQYERDPRLAGETKWKYSKLMHLAFEGITSFSTKPLRIATIAGIGLSLIALVMALAVVMKTLVIGDPVPGYPSMITVILFLGGFQLISVGILGEYVGRLFIESKQRPLYAVMEEIEFEAANAQAKASPATGGFV
jgi:glycosyltransferase involved in cell wall biosynthesis